MQNSSNVNIIGTSAGSSSRPTTLSTGQTTAHSFTSFQPISPEDSKGSFSLAKLFQWRRTESTPDRLSTKAGNVDLRSREGAVSPPRGRPSRSPALESCRQPLQSSPNLKARNSPKIPRSWSSPLFQRRPSPTPRTPLLPVGSTKQLPPSYRNLNALFKRLSIVADNSRGGQLQQTYKESDFKQYWMPDETCKECYECGEKFNTFRRRHHCRVCGQIFCYRCCNVEVPGQLMGYTGGLRVCTYCHKIVLTYTQSPDLIRNLEQLQADLKAVTLESELSMSVTPSSTNLSLARTTYGPFDDDDVFYAQPLSRKASSSSTGSYFDKLQLVEPSRPSSALLPPSRRPFDAFGVCTAEADMLKQDSLRELWTQITSPRNGIELQSHRFRLRNYQNCLVASDLVDWLVNHDKVTNRIQAVNTGQALLESGWLEPVPLGRESPTFKDEYALYQPGPTVKEFPGKIGQKANIEHDSEEEESDTANTKDDEEDDEALPQWFKQLSGYESCEELEEPISPFNVDDKSSINLNRAFKFSSTKLLDLDVTAGVTSEEQGSLSLRVNLQHFGEGNSNGGKETPTDQNHTVSIITEVPPPPLEQYVYTEGYPISSLRAGNRKPIETPLLGASISTDEGAMMAKRMGVARPGSPQPLPLRDDNEERLALERLHKAHFFHISSLLEQLLIDAGLSLEWKDTILPLVDDISERVRPDVRNDDDMDIRQYVKIKKIPGGKRTDCQLVSGVVFTKNISHKKMASTFTNPQILVLCCAIDYQRNENRLASLDPLVLQERNFLKNFVSRVASLRPNVLLVEKTVSRLAQDMLLQHGITLALNVKPEVIERVARCTKADTLRSMEQLSRPRLGTCQLFRVHNFTLKNGETKTLMFLEGCPTELGCTVTLRGGNSFALKKVKKIIQYLSYVAYNQKLEMGFLMDEFSMPIEPETRSKGQVEGYNVAEKKDDLNVETGDGYSTSSTVNQSGSQGEQDPSEDNYAQDFQEALDKLILSSSFFVKYPLPYLLTLEGSKCAVRSALPKEIYWSLKLKTEHRARKLAEDELEEFDFPTPSQRRMSKNVQVLRSHILTSPQLVIGAEDRFVQGVVADFRAQGGRIQLKDKYGETAFERRHSKWERLDLDQVPCSFKSGRATGVSGKGSKDNEKEKGKGKKDFTRVSPVHFSRKIDCLDPQFHQRIAVLFSSYSSESQNSPRPCISPWAVFMEFYGRNDITLGGFLERYCFRPSYVCPNPNCDVPMVDHVRYFAHGTGSVYIHMKNLESPVPGFQHTILTWSWCKECKQVTPIVPLSDSGWALSFAKYLELRFYADSYSRRASIKPCGHSLHREHYQYFAFANMVASFKYRPIQLYETAIPPHTICIKDDRREPSYWLGDLRAMCTRGESVYSAIKDRLESLKVVESGQNHERDSKLLQYASQLQDEHGRFCEQVQAVEKKVTGLQDVNVEMEDESDIDSEFSMSLDNREQQALEYVISDSLNGLKRILCEMVENWNNRLQEFIQAEKKRASKPSPGVHKDGKTVDRKLSITAMPSPVRLTETDAISREELSSPVALPFPKSPLSRRASSPPFSSSTPKTPQEMSSVPVDGSGPLSSSSKEFLFRPIAKGRSLDRENRSSPPERKKGHSLPLAVSTILKSGKDSSSAGSASSSRENSERNSPLEVRPRETQPQSPLLRRSPGKKSAFVRGHRRVVSSPPLISVDSSRQTGGPGFDSKDDSFLKATDNTVLERSRSDSDMRRAETTLLHVVSGMPRSAGVSPSLTEGTYTSEEGLDSDTGQSKEGAARNTPVGGLQVAKKRLGKAQSVPFEAAEQEGTTVTDGAPTLKRKDKMKNIINSLLPGSAFHPVPSTFPSHEHHLLPPGEKVLVVVSEKEPSSIIAYALSTKEYHGLLCEIQRVLARTLKRVTQQQQLYYQHQHLDIQAGDSDSDTGKSKPPIDTDEETSENKDEESDEGYVNVEMNDCSPAADEQFESISSSGQIEIIENEDLSTTAQDKRQPQPERPRLESVKFKKKDQGGRGQEGPDGTNKPQGGGDGFDSPDGKVPKDSIEDPSLAEFGFPQRDANKEPLDYHIKMQFSYTGCRFYCSVYFAEQFRNLRKRIFLEGEERYIRSLAHCVVWRAHGGKSGSAFSKSLDDRFVLKQMSRLELQSFLEFAPHYFQYMNKSLNDKRPPLLAKILGVYRIGYKNSLTNATMRQDVIVMENLFYDRKIDKTFDLKGSMRSRYVQSSGGDDVLMDENLLELIREHPIFIRPHSKAVLSKAIHNDTEFLAQQMVMDYSLLVGIDETRSELVIGIIDFIRTFTWDKKLEMYVKSSGILGGQGKMPTVVSPELYRTRFSEAMQRYFLMVPDKWTGLGTDLD